MPISSNLLTHYALLAYAFDNIDDAVFLIGEDARFIMVNDKACRSLGYSREELLTLQIFDIDPDFRQQDWEISIGKLSVIIETRHKTKDGRTFPVEVCANHFIYEGKVYSMSLVRDISVRKEAEKQFALLNYAIDRVGESVWLIDENAKFHYHNAEGRRAVKYSREELLNLSVPDIDPDYQLDVWPIHWQNLKEKGSLLFESRHQRKDGHIFPVEINANYFEFDGKAYNLALIRDISERKQAQEALQRSEKMLIEAQRIAKIGSWHVDFSNNTLTWSEETYRIWEIEKSQFSATIEAFYDTLHPEDREKVINAYNISVENKTLYQIEHRLLLPDGRIKYIAERGEPFLDENGNIIHFIGTAMDITERKHAERQLEYHASYDLLTGLPNRRMFNNRLHIEILQAQRHDVRIALLFIDLDNFKEINDILGHKTGDYLLIEAAKRIQNCVRQTDTVARLGGDEFVVILSEAGLIPPLERIAASIIDTLAQPFQFSENVIYISGSVGIAIYPQDAEDVDSLMGCADQAMYAAKEIGKNNFYFFKRSMQEQAHERLMLINNLRLAIEKEQFHVYYQPIVDVNTGKIVKAEALIRWIHPTLGMISPAIFIPIAEETNLIQEIGTWVFHQAAKTAQQWNLNHHENEYCKISINMSPRQLIRGEGEKIAIEYLQKMNINPNFVVIEITEGILLDNSPLILEKLERLQAAGLELSLDDFGTGYSAIAYLKKFNLDYLKIDRSFVKDLETQESDVAIAKAIIVMAHHLGLKIIAEGVETQGQRDLLATAGCQYIQGYFYAQPMPKEEFLSFSVP